MKTYLKKLINEYYHATLEGLRLYWLFPVLLISYLLFFHFVLPGYPNCLIKLFFGVPCPTCGLTRSTLALMRFDFAASFKYHPLTLVIYFYMFVFFFQERPLWKKFYKSKIFWIAGIVLLIGVFILRIYLTYPSVPLDPYLDFILGKILNR